VGIHPALPAIGHAAACIMSGSMMMKGAHTSSGGTRTFVPGRVERSPPDAGREQRGKGQNGQEAYGDAHVNCLGNPRLIIPHSRLATMGMLLLRSALVTHGLLVYTSGG